MSRLDSPNSTSVLGTLLLYMYREDVCWFMMRLQLFKSCNGLYSVYVYLYLNYWCERMYVRFFLIFFCFMRQWCANRCFFINCTLEKEIYFNLSFQFDSSITLFWVFFDRNKNGFYSMNIFVLYSEGVEILAMSCFFYVFNGIYLYESMCVRVSEFVSVLLLDLISNGKKKHWININWTSA